jgi:hypothetical protein
MNRFFYKTYVLFSRYIKAASATILEKGMFQYKLEHVSTARHKIYE